MILLKITSLLFLYSFCCLSFGTFLFNGPYRRSRTANEPAITLLATTFLLGQGVYALIWILLGLAGQFSRSIIIILLIIGGASGLYWLRQPILSLPSSLKRVYSDLKTDTWGWQGIALIALAFCAAGVTSLGAPLMEDASNFYMTLPKVLVDTHRLVALPMKYMYYGGGFQGEMHYAVLMALGSPDAARLFSWVTTLAGAAILLSICKYLNIGRRGQWMALAIMMSSSVILTLTGKGKVDMFPMAMGLAACYWAFYLDKPYALRLCGLFIGFAFIGKTIYLVTLVPTIGLFVLWQLIAKEKEQSGVIRPIRIISQLIPKVLTIGVWFLIATVVHFLGNSILYNSALATNSFLSDFIGWRMYKDLVPPNIYLTYPLFAVFGRIRHGQLGGLSPLVLAFAPFVFLLPKPKLKSDQLLWALTLSASVGMGIYILIFPTIVAPRYFMSILFLFIPITVKAAEYVSKRQDKSSVLSFATLAVLYVVLVSAFVENTQSSYYNSFFFYKTAILLQGAERGCQFEDAFSGARCKALTFLNNTTPPGERVLSSVFHNYYMRTDLILCSNNSLFATYLIPDQKPLELSWEKIYKEGYQDIIIDTQYFPFSVIDQKPDWVKAEQVYKSEELQIYHLTFSQPPNLSVKPAYTCQPEGDFWKVVETDQ